MYVISAERSREKSQEKESRRKSGKNLGARKNSMKEKLCTKFVGTYWAPYGREMVIFKRSFFFQTLSLLFQLA